MGYENGLNAAERIKMALLAETRKKFVEKPLEAQNFRAYIEKGEDENALRIMERVVRQAAENTQWTEQAVALAREFLEQFKVKIGQEKRVAAADARLEKSRRESEVRSVEPVVAAEEVIAPKMEKVPEIRVERPVSQFTKTFEEKLGFIKQQLDQNAQLKALWEKHQNTMNTVTVTVGGQKISLRTDNEKAHVILDHTEILSKFITSGKSDEKKLEDMQEYAERLMAQNTLLRQRLRKAGINPDL